MTYSEIDMLISRAKELKDKTLEKLLKDILIKKLQNEKKMLDTVEFS